MSNVGPVCHIPPTNTPANPQPHDLPGLPQSINPKSPSFNNDVANMLNALRMMLLQLSGQLDALRNKKQPFPQNNQQVINGFRTQQDKKANWVQEEQVTEKVKIYQNNDPNTGNFVEVERTNKLVMRDKTTGQTWTWNRPPSSE